LQANRLFGIGKLIEAHQFGTAVLTSDYEEPARTIKQQRERLGLSIHEVAKCVGLPDADVARIEDPGVKNPIRNIEKVARSLALDETNISEISKYNRDSSVAVRLKAFASSDPRLTHHDILAIAEAAWVIKTQIELSRMLKPGEMLNWEKYEEDDNYGNSEYPAWQHGYYLAYKTRESLGLDFESPIQSLRELCEQRLEIPLVYSDLSSHIAGVTVATKECRGIILNASDFGNTWIKRIALAHELGHMLWDSDERLCDLMIDDVDVLNDTMARDYVEQRANAFAIQFLAPQKGIEKAIAEYQIVDSDISRVLSIFGVSYSAGRYHYRNTRGESCTVANIKARKNEPEQDWDGRERFAVDYYPIESVPQNRRGYFSKVVMEANIKGLISDDTAASYLNVDVGTYKDELPRIRELYSS
jgi:Zn-dependent peptidase ImmA (M78 family)